MCKRTKHIVSGINREIDYLHDVWQRCVARLIQPQVGADNSRDSCGTAKKTYVCENRISIDTTQGKQTENSCEIHVRKRYALFIRVSLQHHSNPPIEVCFWKIWHRQQEPIKRSPAVGMNESLRLWSTEQCKSWFKGKQQNKSRQLYIVSSPASISRTTVSCFPSSLNVISDANVACGQSRCAAVICAVWLQSSSIACFPIKIKSAFSSAASLARIFETASGCSAGLHTLRTDMLK